MKNSGNEVDEAGQSLLDAIGAAFVEFRQEAGLTQREAAALSESTQARLSNLENGKNDIFVLTLRRWANVFGYDIEINFIPIDDGGQEEFENNLAAIMREIEEEDGNDTGGAETGVLSEV